MRTQMFQTGRTVRLATVCEPVLILPNFYDSQMAKNDGILNTIRSFTQNCVHVDSCTYFAPFLFNMHLLFVFVSLIDKTNLIEQTQANIFATNSRDVARLSSLRSTMLLNGFGCGMRCISYGCLSMLARFNASLENSTNISFVFKRNGHQYP